MKAYFDKNHYLVVEAEGVTEQMALKYWQEIAKARHPIYITELPQPRRDASGK